MTSFCHINSKPDVARQHPVPPIAAGPRPGFGGANKSYMNQYNKGEYVSKLAVEEKEQELLAKDETIQVRIFVPELECCGWVLSTGISLYNCLTELIIWHV